MTPPEFIAKWRASELKESSAAQEHEAAKVQQQERPRSREPQRKPDRGQEQEQEVSLSR